MSHSLDVQQDPQGSGQAFIKDRPRWPKPVRYFFGLVTASILAAMATTPFSAQHFGSVTPWGVLANIVGIPLTGIFIMTAGMLLSASALIGAEDITAPIMQAGIHLLLDVASRVSALPYAGWLTPPPGYLALTLIVSGIVGFKVFRQPVAYAGIIMLGFAVMFWILRPAPSGVVLARSKTPLLVLAIDNATALA